jgi:DNA-binding MarR family transcriptional regulator
MENRGQHRVLVTFKKLVLMAGYAARAFAKEFDLTPARIDLMLALQFGPTLQRDLARDLAVTPPVVSRMLRALEGLGLVFRRKLEEDRRHRIVALTSWGKSTLETLFDGFFVDDGSITLQADCENMLACDFRNTLKHGGLPVKPLPNVHNRSILWRMLHAVRKRKYFHLDDNWREDLPATPHESSEAVQSSTAP